jgi:hypothetical protein
MSYIIIRMVLINLLVYYVRPPLTMDTILATIFVGRQAIL